MRTIVVADIWGQTADLEQLCSGISNNYKILTPYQEVGLNFENERGAYQYFMHHCGIERYYNSVKAYILEKKIDCNLVGFSAGATVAWMLACSEDLGFIKKAACFYGSRVRYFLDREPGCDVDFIPAKEALFDISKITGQLAKFSMVTLHKNQFSHGFMNRCSENFHPDAYRQYSEWLQEWCTSELNAGAAKLPSPVNRVLR